MSYEKSNVPVKTTSGEDNFKAAFWVIIFFLFPWLFWVVKRVGPPGPGDLDQSPQKYSIMSSKSKGEKYKFFYRKIWVMIPFYWAYVMAYYFLWLAYSPIKFGAAALLSHHLSGLDYLNFFVLLRHYNIRVVSLGWESFTIFIIYALVVPGYIILMGMIKNYMFLLEKKAVLFRSHENIVFPIHPQGSMLHKISEIMISMTELNKGILLLGVPGKGKTETLSTIKYQFHQKLEDACIVFDPKKDYENRFKKKDDIVLGSEGNSTHSWNIFMEVENEEDFVELSKEIFVIPHGTKDPFWLLTSQQLFSAILKMMSREAKKQGTMPTNEDLVRFIMGEKEIVRGKSMEEIRLMLKQHLDLDIPAQYIDPRASGKSESVISTFYAEIQNIFVSDFRKSDKPPFSVRDYMQHPRGRTVFLAYDITRGESLSPIYRLLVDQAMKFAMKRGSEHYKKFFLLDELQHVPHLRHYAQLLNTGRSYQVRPISAVQNEPQLNVAYGRDEKNVVTGGNAYNLVFRCGDNETKKWVQNKIGDIQQVTDSQLWHGSRHYADHPMATNIKPFQDWDYMSLKTGECIFVFPECYGKIKFKDFMESKKIIDYWTSYGTNRKEHYFWKHIIRSIKGEKQGGEKAIMHGTPPVLMSKSGRVKKC